MTFWGYNNEKEASEHWDLSQGKRTEEPFETVNGWITITTVIIGNNKIKF